MFITREITCCGMREIGLLSQHPTPEKAMQAFAGQTVKQKPYPNQNFRYVVFSEAVYRVSNRPGYGRNFANYIREHKLGVVTPTGWHVNPNSGNQLKAWIWTVDWDAVTKWATKKRVKPATSPARGYGLIPVGVPVPPPVAHAGNAVAEQVNARG